MERLWPLILAVWAGDALGHGRAPVAVGLLLTAILLQYMEPAKP